MIFYVSILFFFSSALFLPFFSAKAGKYCGRKNYTKDIEDWVILFKRLLAKQAEEPKTKVSFSPPFSPFLFWVHFFFFFFWQTFFERRISLVIYTKDQGNQENTWIVLLFFLLPKEFSFFMAKNLIKSPKRFSPKFFNDFLYSHFYFQAVYIGRYSMTIGDNYGKEKEETHLKFQIFTPECSLSLMASTLKVRNIFSLLLCCF